MSFRSPMFAAWALALGIALPHAAAQPGPAQKADRLDRFGDPLPEHARLRIGTTRFQVNVDGRGYLTAMAFTKDGKRLVTMNQFSGAQVWDAATGKKLTAFGKPAILGGEFYAISPDGNVAAVLESKTICRFYDTAIGREIGAAFGDWYGVNELRFSPNGKLLGVSSAKEVAVWDVASASKLSQFPRGEFAFASDEQIVVFATRPGSDPKQERRLPLSIYDVKKGPKSRRDCAVEVASARNLALSPDGKLLAADGWRNEFMLWDFTTGKLLHEPETIDDTVWCRRFSPDGKWLVTGSNHGRVRLWDVATGKLQRKFTGHNSTILSLAFSPDSKRVATACGEGILYVWEVESGNKAFDLEGHRMRNVQARFSSDAKTIVSICGFNPTATRSADERTYRFWDAATGKLLKQVELDRKDFLPFCLSGDSRVLFVIDKGEVTKRNLVTDKVEKVLGLPANYYVYRSSFDGKYLAANTADYWAREGGRGEDLGSNFVRVVDTTTGKGVFALDGKKGEHFVCDFTPDGRFLAVHTFRYELVAGGRRASFELRESHLALWDLSTGRKVRNPKMLPKKWESDARWPSGVKLSPSVHLALTRGKDGVVELRELATDGKVAEVAAGSREPESWAFSRDGKFIAAGDEKGQVLLWSVFPPQALVTLSGHSAGVTSVHFSPDGNRLVSGSDDTTILAWDVSRWTTAVKPVPLGANAARSWNDLADPDAAKAHDAMGQLLRSPKETVALLRQNLRPVDAAAAKEVAKLIIDLDSGSFAVRDQAMGKLQKLGFAASSALEKALGSNPTPEARRRFEQLLARLETERMSGDSLQATRALQLLEMLGTSDATELLDALASGDQAGWLTHQAAVSLVRVRNHAGE